jgi:thioredoxin reductase
VAGEELPKVVYRLIDPEQYAGQHVLVVGGGDSALEAAIALAEQPGTTVVLSYRGEAFSRVKEKNRQRLQEMQQENQIRVLLQSQICIIHKTEVTLKHDLAEGDETITLQNDATIICAGGVLPTPLLQKIGVMFETKHGTA